MIHAASLRRLGAVVGLLVAAASSLGCSSDYWVRFQFTTAAPAAVVVESDRIELPAGLAAGVRALPMRDDEQLGDQIPVNLVSRRPSTLGVDQGVEERHFVLFGVEPGTTWVDVYFDDDFITEIPATVVEQ
ncbi:MAG: hypothetical protein JRI23_21295 [Deltaproteobacteria bacterium]|jgi:hypothetical protein|nr:hypothetical protein [Deltaproteobacteria bacterium]MBW2534479.1 hypothetical protein [Deltaproteobacteria bacterium]